MRRLRCRLVGCDEPFREDGRWICPRCGTSRPRLSGAERYPEREAPPAPDFKAEREARLAAMTARETRPATPFRRMSRR